LGVFAAGLLLTFLWLYHLLHASLIFLAYGRVCVVLYPIAYFRMTKRKLCIRSKASINTVAIFLFIAVFIDSILVTKMQYLGKKAAL